jgi:hypothetical protein
MRAAAGQGQTGTGQPTTISNGSPGAAVAAIETGGNHDQGKSRIRVARDLRSDAPVRAHDTFRLLRETDGAGV